MMPGADVKATTVASADGTPLAVHELGEGRPLLLLHGFFSDAQTNWIKYGHAATLAEAGFRVIMPDLRAHGQSGKPHDPRFYPADILANDALGLIAHLGLTDYDLGGYSLGARTAARMIVRGAAPKRLILSGMGLEGLTDAGLRGAYFSDLLDNLGTHKQGSAQWMAEQFLKTTGGDPVALRLLINSFVDSSFTELGGFNLPVGVICGIEDQDNGSAQRLADALPQGIYHPVPGNHMSAVAKPDLGQAFLQFLGRTS